MTDALQTQDPTTVTAVTDRTFAAVLFDMDGTLISSVASVVRSWTRLAQELDIPAISFTELHGVPARDLVTRMLPDRSPAEREHALRRVVELEMEDVDDIEILPGAAEALTALAATGRCAIVTSCGRDLAATRLRTAGVAVPAVVVTADDVRHGKPDPEPFRLGAERLGVDPRQCLVVEDAAAGIASARAAGAATLALTTTMVAERLDGDVVVGDLGAVRFSLVPDGVRVRMV
jgi:mannitol-1-/sugar-/sorbitol-6-phosphatase